MAIPGRTQPTLKTAWWYKPPVPFGGGTELTPTDANSLKIRTLARHVILTKGDEEWVVHLKVDHAFPHPVIQYVLHNEVRLAGTQSNNWTFGSSTERDTALVQPTWWLHIPSTTSTGAASGATSVQVGDLAKVQAITGGIGIVDVYGSNGTTYLGHLSYTARSGTSGAGNITGVPASSTGSVANLTGAAVPASAVIKARIKTSVSSSSSFFLGNPESSGYRSWLAASLATYRAANADNDHWDGVFLDNVDLDGHLATQAVPGNVQPAEYATTALYTAAVNTLVSWQQTNLPGVLWANTVVVDTDSSDYAETSAALDAVIPYLDGLMYENVPLDFQGQWPGTTKYANMMSAVDKVSAAGKQLLMVARLDAPGDYPGGEMAEFAIATALIAWFPGLYFRVSEENSYTQWFPYDQMWWLLGRPTSARSVVSNVYTRTFERGTVEVNVPAQTATITRTSVA